MAVRLEIGELDGFTQPRRFTSEGVGEALGAPDVRVVWVPQTGAFVERCEDNNRRTNRCRRLPAHSPAPLDQLDFRRARWPMRPIDPEVADGGKRR